MYLSLGDSSTRGPEICARQRLREGPCNWWKDYGRTHPEEWPVDSGCSAVQVTQETAGSPRDDGGVPGASATGKILLGIVAMVIIGALASRAKVMKNIGDESIYGANSGADGAVTASDEL